MASDKSSTLSGVNISELRKDTDSKNSTEKQSKPVLPTQQGTVMGNKTCVGLPVHPSDEVHKSETLSEEKSVSSKAEESESEKKDAVFASRITAALDPSWKGDKAGDSNSPKVRLSENGLITLPNAGPSINSSILKPPIPRVSFPSETSQQQSGLLLSSGILPTVDIDKSFDMSIISVEMLEGDVPGSESSSKPEPSSKTSKKEGSQEKTHSSLNMSLLGEDDEEDGFEQTSFGMAQKKPDNIQNNKNSGSAPPATSKVLPPPLPSSRLGKTPSTNGQPVVPQKTILGLPVTAVTKNLDKSEDAAVKHDLEPSKIDNPLLIEVERTKTHLIDVSFVDEGKKPVEQGEVFATKFLRDGSRISTNANVVNSLYSENGKNDLLTPGYHASAPLHPDDVASVQRGTNSVDFVYDHIFCRDNRNLLGKRVDCIGREELVEEVFTEIVRSGGVDVPQIFRIVSDYRFESELFIDNIIKSCRDHLGFGAYYATCDTDIRETTISCLCTLLASRIGIFNCYSNEIKTQRIIASVPELVDRGDVTWAQNVLFAAFGLESLVNKNLSESFTENIDHKLFELFLRAVKKDAENGPVLIFLTHADKQWYDGWREVVAQIRKIQMPNICVFMCGNAVDEYEDTIPVTLGPVSDEAINAYVSLVLKRYKTIPKGFAESIVKKSQGYFTHLWYIVKILEVRGVFSNEHGAPSIEDDGSLSMIQGGFDELVGLHFGSLTQDQSYLITVASILGTPFKLEDISVILALDPLPNEIPWFHDLRHRWTERTIQELLELGEIQCFGDEDSGFVRYRLSDPTGARLLAQGLDETFCKAIHGCYAQLLAQHNPNDPLIGIHFEEAGMWTEASKVWLKLAVDRRNDFFNMTALHLLNNCLRYTAPQHGEIFVALQNELALLASRFGQFQAAQEHYNAMLRVAQLTRDPSGSVEAFIGLAISLLRQGIYNDSRDLLLFGLDLAEALKDKKRISDCYLGLAEIVFRTGNKGAFVGAMRYVERAIELYRSSGDLPALAKTLGLSAEIYIVRGDISRAQSALSESYQALNAAGYWFEKPPVLVAMADAAIQKNNYDDARKYIDEGFKIVGITEDVYHTFMLYEIRAKLNIRLGQRDAVREDISKLQALCAEHPFKPWNVRLRLLIALFDFSRNSYQKTTKALSAFFDIAGELKNNLYLSRGYALSAQLNYEVFHRQIGKVSLEKTEKLFSTATSLFESIGAWHELAENQRRYADFLSMMNRPFEAVQMRERADRVDPFCQ